jgi:hypothetical protein
VRVEVFGGLTLNRIPHPDVETVRASSSVPPVAPTIQDEAELETAVRPLQGTCLWLQYRVAGLLHLLHHGPNFTIPTPWHFRHWRREPTSKKPSSRLRLLGIRPSTPSRSSFPRIVRNKPQAKCRRASMHCMAPNAICCTLRQGT